MAKPTTFKNCCTINPTEWTVAGEGFLQTFPTYNEAREFADAQIILNSQSNTKYRNCTISFDKPPIPSWVGCDYSWSHADYDGAPDGGDCRAGNGASEQACKDDIDEMYENGEME